MNIRPTVEVEFDDNYLNARSKVIECVNAVSKLTPQQRECLARELAIATGMEMMLEEFLRYMNRGGVQ